MFKVRRTLSFAMILAMFAAVQPSAVFAAEEGTEEASFNTVVYENFEGLNALPESLSASTEHTAVDTKTGSGKFGFGNAATSTLKASGEKQHMEANTGLSLADLAVGTYVETEFDLSTNLVKKDAEGKDLSGQVDIYLGGSSEGDSILRIFMKQADTSNTWKIGYKTLVTDKTSNITLASTEYDSFHSFKIVMKVVQNEGAKAWFIQEISCDGQSGSYRDAAYAKNSVDYDALRIYTPLNGDGSRFSVDNLAVRTYTLAEGTTASPVPNRRVYRESVNNIINSYGKYAGTNEAFAAAIADAETAFNSDASTEADFAAKLAALEACTRALPQKVLFYDFVNSGTDKVNSKPDRVCTIDSDTFKAYDAYGAVLNGADKNFRFYIEPVTFADLPNSSYIVNEFDIAYSNGASDSVRLKLRNTEQNTDMLELRFSDTQIYCNNDSTHRYKGSEFQNKMHRIKLVWHVKDSAGAFVHQLTEMYVDGMEILEGNPITVPNAGTAGDYGYVLFQGNKTDAVPYPSIWLDNFSVATYSSEDGTSPIGEKYPLLTALNTASESIRAFKANNPDTTAGLEPSALLANGIEVLQDAAATQAEIDAASGETEQVVNKLADDGNSYYISGVNVDGTVLKSVTLFDKNTQGAGAVAIAAVYAGGVLRDVELIDVIPEADALWTDRSFNLKGMSLSSAGDETIKVFVFDGASTIKPMANAYTK
ncbi:MAG: hypothetical protein J6N52_07775 [Clostridia bacterium]|nr:hypothetical protein [Clostridia bacterium]